MFDPLATQRLLALFIAGWLLFNFPLLSILDRPGTLFGLPFFPTAVFIAWAVLIGVLACISERGDDGG